MATVGVILTLYNDYNYLDQCLSHLLQASTKNKVIICFCIDEIRYFEVNRKILDNLIETYNLTPEFAFNNKGGPSLARNLGVRHMLKKIPAIDYFYFMDADNYLGPNTIDILVDCLDNTDSSIGFTYQDIHMFEERNTVVRLDVPFNQWRLLIDFYGEVGNLIKAGVFRDGFYFDHEMRKDGEDVEFYRRISGKYKGIYCPDTLFKYRSKTVSRNETYWLEVEARNKWIREKNMELYEKSSEDFFADNLFDFFSLSNPAVDPILKRFSYYIDHTERKIFEMLKSTIFLASEYSSFEQLKASPFSGLILTDIFSDKYRVLRLYRFSQKNKNELFRYKRTQVNFKDISENDQFVLASFPATFGLWHQYSFSNHLQNNIPVELIEIESSNLPEAVTFNKNKIMEFFQEIVNLENKRSIADKYKNFEDVFAFPNHSDWFRDNILTDLDYIGNQRKYLADDGQDDKKSICVLAPFIGVGGADISIINIIKSIKNSIPDAVVDVVLSHFQNSESGANQGDNNTRLDCILPYIDTIIFTDFIQPDLRSQFLTALLPNYDLIYIGTSYPVYSVLKQIKNSGRKPKIVSQLFCWDYHKGIRVGFPIEMPKVSYVVDVFSCQTQLVADYLITRQVPQEKIFHIPYRSRFEMQRVDKSTEKLIILWSGRWGEQKNPSLLVDIVEQSLKICRGVHFVIQILPEFDNQFRFDQSNYKRLMKLRAEYTDDIEIIEGPVTDEKLQELYAQAHVLLNSSRWEGLPFTFYEAMSFGCIPLATNVSSNEELIINGYNGYLINDLTPSAFVETIKLISEDRKLLQELNNNVYTTLSEFNTDFISELMQLFKQLLDNQEVVSGYKILSAERKQKIVDDEIAELAAVVEKYKYHDLKELIYNPKSINNDSIIEYYKKISMIDKVNKSILNRYSPVPFMQMNDHEITADIEAKAARIARELANNKIFRKLFLKIYPTAKNIYFKYINKQHHN